MKFSTVFSFSSIFFFLALFSACNLQRRVSADGTMQVVKTITVAQSGTADFLTIQDAVNAVPDGNTEWIEINVAQGIYKEKVLIPVTKQFIYLKGQGPDTTIIQWGSYVHEPTAPTTMRGLKEFFEPLDINSIDTFTFTTYADNFIARGITFRNTYDYRTKIDIAVAAVIGGDKASFFNCKFLGYQDTLCDYTGRHYFSECWIEGAVDFIWGQATSVYEDCTINSIMETTGAGWVTAHAKISDAPAGFVFKSCNLIGNGQMYLGRAWNEQSTVVFYDTSMADIVVPAGWDAWGKDVSGTTYAENGCTGPGSNLANRVPWEKTLDDQGLEWYIGDSFNNAEGWISEHKNLIVA